MPSRIGKPLLSPGKRFMQGNIACCEGALAAGCRFYAGYPITPSSEIMEHAARRMPDANGVFVQMEDEIASIAACIGAAWAGAKAMTATSGPGFSLISEGIGYAIMTETPCVIVDVMRQGPATGQATRPGQGDVMQARWSAHGDYRIIALSPWSCQEMYDLTIRAFNLAERFRVPVIVLADEVVGHMKESVTIAPEVPLFDRNREPGKPPFGGELVPPMPAFGDGQALLVTGSTHDEWGYRKVSDPDAQERLNERICEKIERNWGEIVDLDVRFAEDCDTLLVAYGITARSAYYAAKTMRAEGGKVGLLRLRSIWPFPENEIAEAGRAAKKVLVCEMNRGQLIREIQRTLGDKEISGLFKTRGEPIYPREIVSRVKSL